MYNMYGCPMHYGAGDKGLIYSLDFLNQYYDLHIPIVPEITVPEKNLPNLKNLNSVVTTCYAIAKFQHRIIVHGDTPLFIAGDHSAAIGSISGTSARYENLGLIWIDAQPDINTDKTTVTGNIHGMSVAALLGIGEKSLTKVFKPGPKLKAENIVMIGLRDIDRPEQVLLDDLKIKYYTYDQVCCIGLDTCIDAAIRYLSHLDAIHLSFALDSLDPAIIPGVSNHVPRGFDVGDAHHMITAFLKELPIAAMDIVEFNVVHDVEHRTSDFVDQLIRWILRSNETLPSKKDTTYVESPKEILV